MATIQYSRQVVRQFSLCVKAHPVGLLSMAAALCGLPAQQLKRSTCLPQRPLERGWGLGFSSGFPKP